MNRDSKIESHDNELIKKSIGGDNLAFEQLLGKYLKPIYGFLYTLIRDSTQVDDVAQETFIKAWKNLSKFDRKRSFKTWLFAIAKNSALDYLKKKKSLPFSFFEDAEGNSSLEEKTADDMLGNEILEKADLAKEIEQKLELLSEDYKTILDLRYKEDFSLSEIAEILDRPYNTVKAYHARALTKLKQVILDE